MGQFSKRFEDLQFSDNYIFCKVMKNKSICKRMLEILLGMEIESIEYVETEHPIENYYDARGIRLDVFVKSAETVYNIEMQTVEYKDLLLRARYYLGAADVSSTPRRTQFKNLKNTYILFICKNDPFDVGEPVYTEKKGFVETDKVSFDDKSLKIFYNSSAYAKVADEELRDVLEFIYTLKARSRFTKQLENFVEDAKAKSVFKDEYMYFADILEDEKEEARAIGLEMGRAEGREVGLAEGRAEGRAEGLVEGRTEGLVEGRTEGRAEGLAEGRAEGREVGLEEGKIIAQKSIAINLLNRKSMSLEEVSMISGLSLGEIKQLWDDLNIK